MCIRDRLQVGQLAGQAGDRLGQTGCFLGLLALFFPRGQFFFRNRLTAGTMVSATNGYFDIEFSFVGDGSVAPGSYADVYLLGNPDVYKRQRVFRS